MNIKTLALILIVILPLALNAQYDDYYDDYYYEDYAYEVVATQYEVITNAQGKCGLATIADKKLVIPYLYKSIEIKETPIGNEEIYFVVTNDADLSGVYSLKAKKEIVPIKYSAIEFYYYDFFPNDDENPKTFCVFIASTFPQDEIPKDYYAQNGQFLLSTQHEIEWSLNSGTDVLTGIMFTKDNYSDKQGYIIFERTTGKVLQNRKCELFGYGWFDQYIVKENNKYGVLNILTNKYLINPDCDSISDIPQYIVYKNGQVAYINTSGKTIFPFGTYNKIGFEGSIEVDDEYLTAISVSNNNKWGCVDTLKKVIIPIMYDYEFEFSDTMWVSNNGKWGAIDRFNNTVVEFQYDEAKPDYFEDFDLDDPISFEYYSISKDKKWGCIMNNGAILWPVVFD